SSTRSAPFSRAIRDWRSASAALSARTTAATFVILSLLNRLAYPHPEVAAAFLEPQEHFVPGLHLADGKRASLRRPKPTRLRVLADRGTAPKSCSRRASPLRPARENTCRRTRGRRARSVEST